MKKHQTTMELNVSEIDIVKDVVLQCHSFIVQMFELLNWIGKDIE